MKSFASKYAGLTIVMEPVYEEKDIRGRILKVHPGKKIQFVDGAFTPQDADEEEFVSAYSKRHSDIVTVIGEDTPEIVNEIRDVVRRRRGQGAQGVPSIGVSQAPNIVITDRNKK